MSYAPGTVAQRLASSILVLAIALGAADARALPPVQRTPECRAFTGDTAPVHVGWSGITRSPTCWFFSGPGDLGRDDHLGDTAEWSRNADRVTLRFGPVVFGGTIAGDRVSLRRVSDHASGAGWRVTETIEGTLAREGCPRLIARYHYDECETSVGPCPGQCHIDAAIVIEGR